MGLLIRLIYPEKRTVTAAQVLLWAADALANGETEDDAAGNVREAVRILEDIGHITADSIKPTPEVQ